jgi:hypothetical protein
LATELLLKVLELVDFVDGHLIGVSPVMKGSVMLRLMSR